MSWRTDDGSVDYRQIGADLDRLGKIWADLDHAQRLLEKTKDTVFAKLVFERVEAGESRSKAELAVKASDAWENHIYATVAARHQANLAKVAYEAAKAEYEALRTAEATRRVEMNTLHRS